MIVNHHNVLCFIRTPQKEKKTGISTCPLTHMKFLAGSIL